MDTRVKKTNKPDGTPYSEFDTRRWWNMGEVTWDVVAFDDAGVVPGKFEASVMFNTDAEATAFAARFPKFVKFISSGCSGDKDGKSYQYGSVHMVVRFDADGVNKGKNETGIKRLKGFFKTCKALGIVPVHIKPFTNSIDFDVEVL